MEGLASLYASSGSSSDEDDNVEININEEGFLAASGNAAAETVHEGERTIYNTLSMTEQLLSSQKKQQQHCTMTTDAITTACSAGCNHPQEHDDPEPPQQQQLDRSNHPRKRARPEGGVVKFITLQEYNTTALFVRSQPHVPGNWAGHVFVNLSPHASCSATSWNVAETKCLDRIRKRFESSSGGYNINNNNGSNTGAVVVVHGQMNWHVSLSRPFYLQAACIDSFVKELEQSLTGVVASSRTIRLLPHECTLLVNDDKTRSFWVWPVQPSLKDLVQIVDRILLKYKQPMYYKPAHFHISVASIPEDLSTFWNQNSRNNSVDRRESIDDNDDVDEEEDESLYARITEVQCVIGNKSFSFPLTV
jgi:Uncharacterised conserved protein